jgi:hypothetical protein
MFFTTWIIGTPKVHRPRVYGRKWCWDCYGFLFGVSLSSMDRLKKLVKDGKRTWQRKSGSGKNRAHPKAPEISKFLDNLKKMSGEHIPDAESNKYVHVPSINHL